MVRAIGQSDRTNCAAPEFDSGNRRQVSSPQVHFPFGSATPREVNARLR